MINDSAPGLAVESIRGKMRDMRRSVVSGQHMTGELQSLVNVLNEQIQESSMILPYSDYSRDPSFPKNVERIETDSRECEILRKGMERCEKQLVQIIKN